jgi:hypothetical protein
MKSLSSSKVELNAASPIGYTLLDNGKAVCVTYPVIPGAREVVLDGSRLEIHTDAGTAFLGKVTSHRLVDCIRANCAIAVGIDTLARAVGRELRISIA